MLVTLLGLCCALLNVTASPALNIITPIEALTDQVPDFSHFLYFSFWEPVYCNVDANEPDHKFPSQPNEKRGYWVSLLTSKVINLLGRYSLMKPNRLLQDLLLEVLSRLLQISG